MQAQSRGDHRRQLERWEREEKEEGEESKLQARSLTQTSVHFPWISWCTAITPGATPSSERQTFHLLLLQQKKKGCLKSVSDKNILYNTHVLLQPLPFKNCPTIVKDKRTIPTPCTWQADSPQIYIYHKTEASKCNFMNPQ